MKQPVHAERDVRQLKQPVHAERDVRQLKQPVRAERDVRQMKQPVHAERDVRQLKQPVHLLFRFQAVLPAFQPFLCEPEIIRYNFKTHILPAFHLAYHGGLPRTQKGIEHHIAG